MFIALWSLELFDGANLATLDFSQFWMTDVSRLLACFYGWFVWKSWVCLFFVASRLQVTISFTMKNKVVHLHHLDSWWVSLGRQSVWRACVALWCRPAASGRERAFSLEKSYFRSMQVYSSFILALLSVLRCQWRICLNFLRLRRQGNLQPIFCLSSWEKTEFAYFFLSLEEKWLPVLQHFGKLHFLLILKYQKSKIMASGPISSWQIDGKTVETMTDFIFWGSKITVDGDCSHEIKRHLLLGSKAVINLDSVLKSRDITLLTKVCIVKAMVFPVIIYGCENWTIKNAEHWRTDAFELWCWKRLLRVPWTARRSTWSILKEIKPEYSLEGLKLKLQYFDHLIWRADSLEKTLMLGKIEGRRRRGWQRTTWLDGIIDSVDMSLSKFQEIVEDRKAWCPWGHKESNTTDRLNNTNQGSELNGKSLLTWWLEIWYTVYSTFGWSRNVGTESIYMRTSEWFRVCCLLSGAVTWERSLVLSEVAWQ